MAYRVRAGFCRIRQDGRCRCRAQNVGSARACTLSHLSEVRIVSLPDRVSFPLHGSSLHPSVLRQGSIRVGIRERRAQGSSQEPGLRHPRMSSAFSVRLRASQTWTSIKWNPGSRQGEVLGGLPAAPRHFCRKRQMTNRPPNAGWFKRFPLGLSLRAWQSS